MYKELLTQLNNTHIWYKNPRSIGMHILSTYYSIQNEKHTHLLDHGALLSSLFAKVNSLYINAIKRKQSDLLLLIENGVLHNPLLRFIHRELCTSSPTNTPSFFRGDSPDGNRFVEFHSGFRGLGYLCALRKYTERYFGINTYLQHSNILKCSYFFYPYKSTLLLYEPFRTSEITYAIQNMCTIPLITLKQRFYTAYNRFPFSDHSLFMCNNNYPSLLLLISPTQLYWGTLYNWYTQFYPIIKSVLVHQKHYLLNNIVQHHLSCEPLPNILFEHKIIMALVWEKPYRDMFTDLERSLFPETYIIKPNTTVFINNHTYSLDDIVALSTRKRSFIIKYAGCNPLQSSGGKTVFRLKKMSSHQCQKLIQYAISSFVNYGEPWIIQNDISQKDHISFYNILTDSIHHEHLYSLFRPYYFHDNNTHTTILIDVMVHFRSMFKVHATRDSIIGLAAVN